MTERILDLLKKDMNGLTLDEIKKAIPGAGLSHLKSLRDNGKVRLDGQLYKATPAAWS